MQTSCRIINFLRWLQANILDYRGPNEKFFGIANLIHSQKYVLQCASAACEHSLSFCVHVVVFWNYSLHAALRDTNAPHNAQGNGAVSMVITQTPNVLHPDLCWISFLCLFPLFSPCPPVFPAVTFFGAVSVWDLNNHDLVYTFIHVTDDGEVK